MLIRKDPPKRSNPNHTDWRATVAFVRHHPYEWFLLGNDLSSSKVSHARRRYSHLGIEARQSGTSPDGNRAAEVFVRYNPDKDIASDEERAQADAYDVGNATTGSDAATTTTD